MANFKPFDMKQKVLITGAAGFIGFHLAKRLLTKGATVMASTISMTIMTSP